MKGCRTKAPLAERQREELTQAGTNQFVPPRDRAVSWSRNLSPQLRIELVVAGVSPYTGARQMQLDSRVSKRSRRRMDEGKSQRPTLGDRIARLAVELEDQASSLQPGPERNRLLIRAHQMKVNNDINEWLTAPAIQPPK